MLGFRVTTNHDLPCCYTVCRQCTFVSDRPLTEAEYLQAQSRVRTGAIPDLNTLVDTEDDTANEDDHGDGLQETYLHWASLEQLHDLRLAGHLTSATEHAFNDPGISTAIGWPWWTRPPPEDNDHSPDTMIRQAVAGAFDTPAPWGNGQRKLLHHLWNQRWCNLGLYIDNRWTTRGQRWCPWPPAALTIPVPRSLQAAIGLRQ